jgi:hypothetical protein
MQNHNVSEERKSQPLYGDLETSSDLNHLTWQKYAGDDIVDLVSVVMHWIENASEKNTQVLGNHQAALPQVHAILLPPRLIVCRDSIIS